MDELSPVPFDLARLVISVVKCPPSTMIGEMCKDISIS